MIRGCDKSYDIYLWRDECSHLRRDLNSASRLQSLSDQRLVGVEVQKRWLQVPLLRCYTFVNLYHNDQSTFKLVNILVCLCSLQSGWGRFTGEGSELRNKIPTTTTRAHLLQRHPGRGLADKDVETHLRNRVKNLWEVRSVQAGTCLHCVLNHLKKKLL